MTALPFLSVIMPIRNEGAIIRESLEAVLAQDYDQDRMEILVVDGMSTDDTRQIVLSMQFPFTEYYSSDNPGKIVPVGMNIALRRARGDIFVRVDGHCTIARDYVSRCVGHLQNDGVDGVGGPVHHTVGSTRVARVIALAMSSKFGVGGSAFRTVTDRTMLAGHGPPFRPTPAQSSSVPGRTTKKLVRNQDDEYNYRLRKLGAKLSSGLRCPVRVFQPELPPVTLAPVLPVRLLERCACFRNIPCR